MPVKTRWERPEVRRFLSVSAPLIVDWHGERVRAEQWSLGGLRVTGTGSPVPEIGSIGPLKLMLPFQGFEMAFQVTAKVVDRDIQTGACEVEFVDLGSRERDLMCHFLDELVRGSMSEVEGTIRRIDVPVQPLALEADAAMPEPGSRPGRTANAGLMTALYSIIGLIVFGYFGLLAYGHFFRFEIDTATFSVPTEPVLSHGEGHVQWAAFRPGDEVKAGDVILGVYDNQLERDIELGGISLREKEAKLLLLQRRAGDEPQRISNIATTRSQSVARMRLEIDSLVARQQGVEQEAKRISALPRTSQNIMRVEENKKRILAYQKAIEGKQLELKARLEREIGPPAVRPTQSLAQPDATLIRELSPVETQVAQVAQELEFAQLRLQALIAHRDRLAARAPFDGILVGLPRGDKAGVRRGEVVALVEQRAAPTVTAYLSANDALRIGIGDAARVYVPSAGAFLRGKVASIDRTEAISRDRTSAPHAMSTRSSGWSKVDLRVEKPEQLVDRNRFQAGLPVVVQFERRWVSTIVAVAATEKASRFMDVGNWLSRIVSRAQARQP